MGNQKDTIFGKKGQLCSTLSDCSKCNVTQTSHNDSANMPNNIEILFNLKYPSRQKYYVIIQTFQILLRASASIRRILWGVKPQGKNLPKFYTVKRFLIFFQFICPSIEFKIIVLHDGMPYIVIMIKAGLKTKVEITSFTYLLI